MTWKNELEKQTFAFLAAFGKAHKIGRFFQNFLAFSEYLNFKRYEQQLTGSKASLRNTNPGTPKSSFV